MVPPKPSPFQERRSVMVFENSLLLDNSFTRLDTVSLLTNESFISTNAAICVVHWSIPLGTNICGGCLISTCTHQANSAHIRFQRSDGLANPDTRHRLIAAQV